MNATLRTVAPLLSMLLVLVLWLGGTVGCVVYACQPGNAGALLGAAFVFLMGLGFWHEARESLN